MMDCMMASSMAMRAARMGSSTPVRNMTRRMGIIWSMKSRLDNMDSVIPSIWAKHVSHIAQDDRSGMYPVPMIRVAARRMLVGSSDCITVHIFSSTGVGFGGGRTRGARTVGGTRGAGAGACFGSGIGSGAGGVGVTIAGGETAFGEGSAFGALGIDDPGFERCCRDFGFCSIGDLLGAGELVRPLQPLDGALNGRGRDDGCLTVFGAEFRATGGDKAGRDEGLGQDVA